MLDKSDKKEIREMMVDVLGEFFDDVLSPYLDNEHKENQMEHAETRRFLKESLNDMSEAIKNHDRRISKLEVITQS